MTRVFAIGVGLVGLGVAMVSLAAEPASAQTIYPLDRAEILAGAKFDLKVEFPGAPAKSAVRVTLNGEDAAAVARREASFVEREDGADHSAYWLRDITLTKPGKYVAEAISGDKT